jgi:hypothetical protein
MDVKLVRAVTDMMIENAWMIPINEGINGPAMRPYVNGYYGGVIIITWEDVWLDK